MSIIEVNDVVKRYKLGQSHNIRQSLRRMLGQEASGPKRAFNALDGIRFKVDAGEVLGIIGTNGAGKSTLLKVLSGITTPTSGSMIARGRVAPLIEVGAGLIADLTGRENIYLNGVILGMSVKEIKRKFDDIVGFAELGPFIDTPIKRYSSGMAIRLGFSIATAVESDILIVDEVLAVGDLAFQRKCFDRIEDIIKNQGKTILLVSHNIRQVERLCTRALLLDHGRVLVDGEPRDVCRQFYERTNAKVKANAVSARSSNRANGVAPQWEHVELLGMNVLDADERATDVVTYMKDIVVEIRFRAVVSLNRLVFGVGIHTSDMLYLATHDSDLQLEVETLDAGEYTIRCLLKRPPLVPGVYSLRLGISENDGSKQAFYGENLVHFQVTPVGSDEEPPISPDGFFALDGHWLPPEAVVASVRTDGVLEAA